MVIEIVPEAAKDVPNRMGLCIRQGAPYFIPPETLVNIPAAQDETNQQS
jgi:hypothetical protein